MWALPVSSRVLQLAEHRAQRRRAGILAPVTFGKREVFLEHVLHLVDVLLHRADLGRLLDEGEFETEEDFSGNLADTWLAEFYWQVIVESAPDTIISLTTGKKILVKESDEEVIRRAACFRPSLPLRARMSPLETNDVS